MKKKKKKEENIRGNISFISGRDHSMQNSNMLVRALFMCCEEEGKRKGECDEEEGKEKNIRGKNRFISERHLMQNFKYACVQYSCILR